MKNHFRAMLGLAVGASAAALLFCTQEPQSSALSRPMKGTPMFRAAQQFVETLGDSQKQKALIPFESEERLNWHYIPRTRLGLPFKEMNPAQQEAAIALLKVSLSEEGMKKTMQIRELESVLREIEQGSGPLRDPDNYFFSVFGSPADKGTWGWRYEGHHISLNWTIVGGKSIASSPQFMGTNPGEVRSGKLQGLRVLGVEEDLGRSLVQSLNAEQRKAALVSEKAPADIFTEAKRKAEILEDSGVAYNALNKEQKGVLISLIREFANVQNPDLAKKRLDKVRKAGLSNIKFAWMGGVERGQGHYYRVQGATFLIEYDNTQNNANHVHAVWRDFKGDFGADLLEEHYHAFKHEQGKHEPRTE